MIQTKREILVVNILQTCLKISSMPQCIYNNEKGFPWTKKANLQRAKVGSCTTAQLQFLHKSGMATISYKQKQW